MFKSIKKGTEDFGKIKKETFDFFRIEKFFKLSDKAGFHQIISDRTFSDLDMDEIFMFIDRTTSKIGQQLLYHTIRTIPRDGQHAQRFEKCIESLNKNPETKSSILLQLSRLQSDDAYNLPALFLKEHMRKPAWFGIVPALSVASVLAVLMLFFVPQAFIALIILLAINFGFHYWNKNNLYMYRSSVSQLSLLTQVAKNLAESNDLGKTEPEIQDSISAIDSLGAAMSLFKMEAKLQSEIGQLVDYLLELVKALFLIEPLVLFHVLDQLDKKRKEIDQIFNFVGEIDVALSIDFLRKDLPHFCIPNLEGNKNTLTASDIYHPLIDQWVPNSITLAQKSALLTGSNMSGKTTFIRTIGINAILAQTIGTCFAKQFEIPLLRVHSAIRISDDLLSEKSYYFEEVLAVKALLNESRSGDANLFLLDEIFKGTNTVERIAAGKAVLEYLSGADNIVFVTSHDLELADLLRDTFSAYHFTEVVENDDIHFDYQIKPGVLTNTNAIRILELNGYPAEVTQEAFKLARKSGNINVTGSGI
ncbi:MutS-related protein [Dyadobacter luticola]|uniref:DNA mismatch repair protein MutS n=1 Tax=Dyadobacter luticola TaxID=1979387 RepID=A0A5R9L3I6_9BACT|nr:DNA mismatch repair protein MutS [Dyadobacter luticola]TLV02830.1 DNA mismatch repair protein MutS [Dyadobacter luticola]